MKKYVVQDTITDTETGNKLIYFCGVDGYIQENIRYCVGYTRKGCAINHIKRGAQFCADMWKNEPLKETTNEQGETLYIWNEGKRWQHSAKVVEIEQ